MGRVMIYADKNDGMAPDEVWLEWSTMEDGTDAALEDDFLEAPERKFMPVRYVKAQSSGRKRKLAGKR